ncbi:hypothetical protein VNI00_000255 [Paramarasmius palmivorus]|uniref:Fatty acid desaturase n=1 Tax=Paramarasmius palmivorus TaxID=297713 RepID=A0AAW0EGC1_9AGAR
MDTLYRVFADSPEYLARKNTPFSPTKVTHSELRAVIPQALFEKNTLKGLLYVARDVICAVLVYKLGVLIDPTTALLISRFGVSPLISIVFKWTSWAVYWYCQSVILAGWWCMAHEAGHGNISPHEWVNHLVGFSLHTVGLLLDAV